MGTTCNGLAIRCRVLGIDDVNDVVEIYENTMIFEDPGYRALEMKAPEDTMRIHDVFIPKVLTSGLSIGAFDCATDELIGWRLSAVQQSTEDPDAYVYDAKDPYAEKLAKVEKCTKQLFEGLQIFELAGANEIVRFHGLAVRSSHRRRGIGRQLVEESIVVAREKGYKAIVVEASSHYSRAIFNRLGFDTLRTIKALNLIIDGKPLYSKGIEWPHELASVHMLKL